MSTTTLDAPRARAKGKGLGGRVNTFPLVAPSVAVLLVWSIIPLLVTLYFSFRRYFLLYPERTGWAGIKNYVYLLQDPALYSALWVTVLLVGSVLVTTICLGAVLAALFSKDFWGQGVARVLMISPFFVMPTVAALIWKNLLMHPVNGVIAAVLHAVGLNAIDWFGQFPLASVIIIVSWEWLPFAFLILLTALQSLDEEQLEAAWLEGAGVLEVFFSIQVPHMARAISVVVMMEMIFLLGVFAEIYVTTGGGPGVATSNLAFLIYQRALLAFNVGGASAAGVIAIVVANVIAAFLVRTVAKRLDA